MEQIFEITIRDMEFEDPDGDEVEGPVLEDIIRDGLEDAYGDAGVVIVKYVQPR
jgi:hypothetical protein